MLKSLLGIYLVLQNCCMFKQVSLVLEKINIIFVGFPKDSEYRVLVCCQGRPYWKC